MAHGNVYVLDQQRRILEFGLAFLVLIQILTLLRQIKNMKPKNKAIAVYLDGEDPERDYSLVVECLRQDLAEVL